MSNLSSIIELSESNTNEQNSEVLSTVANYTTKLATFVGDSNVIINDIVSRPWNQEGIIMIVITYCNCR